MATNRSVIVKREFQVSEGQQIGPWTCQAVRKVFIHNHGPAAARVKVWMLAGMGDSEDRVVFERHYAAGSQHEWKRGQGTARTYRIELVCEGSTKIYVHAERH